MSIVMRLMGIGGETKRLATNKSISPTMALTASPTNSAVVRASKANTASTAMTTTMSTSNSMEEHYTRNLGTLVSPEKSSGRVFPLSVCTSCRKGVFSATWRIGEVTRCEQRVSPGQRPLAACRREGAWSKTQFKSHYARGEESRTCRGFLPRWVWVAPVRRERRGLEKLTSEQPSFREDLYSEAVNRGSLTFDRGSALLRGQPSAPPKEPYDVKAVTTKNAPVTTTAAATM